MGSKKNTSVHSSIVIRKPIVIAVEGLDYFHTLLHQIDGPDEFADVELVDYAPLGIGAAVAALVKDSKFVKGEVRAFGIIRDAEDSRDTAEAATRTVLNSNGLSVPDQQMIVARGVPSVGYLIIPHDKSTGCLEDACLDASTLEPEHVACASEFLEKVSPFHKPPLNKNGRTKLKVHALIAGSGKNPAMTLGQSVRAGLWDFERESLKIMLDFIRMLRDA